MIKINDRVRVVTSDGYDFGGAIGVVTNIYSLNTDSVAIVEFPTKGVLKLRVSDLEKVLDEDLETEIESAPTGERLIDSADFEKTAIEIAVRESNNSITLLSAFMQYSAMLYDALFNDERC